jgi:hypothetical protein
MAKKAAPQKPKIHPAVSAFMSERGKLGGTARANNLTPERRREIAVMGSKAAAKKRREASAA